MQNVNNLNQIDTKFPMVKLLMENLSKALTEEKKIHTNIKTL